MQMGSTGIGDRLRTAREALGLSLEEVEAATRIRRSYLEALEHDALDRLPGPAYARGFLRAYAKHLGIPPEDVDLAPPGASTASPGPGKPSSVEVRLTPASRLSPARRALLGLGVLGAVGLAFVVIVVWGQVRQFIQSAPSPRPAPAGSRPAAPAPQAAHGAAPAPPPAVAPHPAAPAPPSHPGSPAAPPAPAATPAVPAQPSDKPAAAIPVHPTPSAPAAVPAPARPATPGNQPPPSTPTGSETPSGAAAAGAPSASQKTAGNPPLKVAVSATSYSWVRTVADGTTVFEGFLNAGDKQVWQANRSLSVRVGNAAAITIAVNGRPVGPLGASGQVYEHTFSAGTP